MVTIVSTTYTQPNNASHVCWRRHRGNEGLKSPQLRPLNSDRPTLTTTSDICDRHGPGSPSDTHNRYGRNCVFLSMSASHGSRKSVHRGPLVPQLSFGPAPACHSRPHRPSSPGTSSAHGPLCCYRSANVALPCSSLAHHVSPVVQQSAIARGMPASIRYASLGSPMSRLMSSNPLQGSQSTKQMAESAFCFSPKCSLHCVAPSPHALIPMDPPVSFNSHLPRHLLNVHFNSSLPIKSHPSTRRPTHWQFGDSPA